MDHEIQRLRLFNRIRESGSRVSAAGLRRHGGGAHRGVPEPPGGWLHQLELRNALRLRVFRREITVAQREASLNMMLADLASRVACGDDDESNASGSQASMEGPPSEGNRRAAPHGRARWGSDLQRHGWLGARTCPGVISDSRVGAYGTRKRGSSIGTLLLYLS